MQETTTITQEGRRTGWYVFLALAIATAIEFAISAAVASPILFLVIIALIKAYLIIRYFMRVGNLKEKEA